MDHRGLSTRQFYRIGTRGVALAGGYPSYSPRRGPIEWLSSHGIDDRDITHPITSLSQRYLAEAA
jgi:hypothetical protein